VTPNENETISPKTPVSDTVPAPAEPQSISGVLTDEPASSEPSHIHTASVDDTLPEVSADGPLPLNTSEDADIKEETVVEDSPAKSTDKSTELDIEIPNSITQSTPIAISSTAKSPETGNSNGHVASSIDEAIADFKTAIKTPEPESVKAPETLSATEIDETSAQPESSNTIEPERSAEETPNASGDANSSEKVNGTNELSATAPRSVSASPAPLAKEIDDHHSEQGEGTTMEEIDID